MAITLPFTFDTTWLGKFLLKGALAVGTVFLLFTLKGLIIGNLAYVLGGALPALVIYFYSISLFKKVGGATGTITQQEITVQPARFLGLSSEVPKGTFPISQFSSLCVIWRPRVGGAQVQISPGNNEDIYLTSRTGTEDIEIVRITNGSGQVLAQELGALLGLKVEVKPGPGVHSFSRNFKR